MLEERQTSQQVVLRKLDNCRKLKLDPYFTLCTKLDAKQIKDIEIRTLNTQEDRIGKLLADIGIGTHFINKTTFAQEIT